MLLNPDDEFRARDILHYYNHLPLSGELTHTIFLSCSLYSHAHSLFLFLFLFCLPLSLLSLTLSHSDTLALTHHSNQHITNPAHLLFVNSSHTILMYFALISAVNRRIGFTSH